MRDDEVTADVNGDGAIDANDGLLPYHACTFRPAFELETDVGWRRIPYAGSRAKAGAAPCPSATCQWHGASIRPRVRYAERRAPIPDGPQTGFIVGEIEPYAPMLFFRLSVNRPGARHAPGGASSSSPQRGLAPNRPGSRAPWMSRQHPA